VHLEAASQHLPGDAEWRALTVLAGKSEAFREDLYFRECWADVEDVLAGAGPALLSSLALLTFKCDGVAGRRMVRTLEFLEQHGFTVIGVAPIRLDRHSMRELWRYNWHVYPTDRLNLMSVMHTATDSLLFLLRDRRYDGVVPGATRLADLKGAADPAQRRPHELRAVLEPPNSVINFVHVADEPADVVRELAIFLDRPQRREVLTSARENAGGDLTPVALSAVRQLEQRYAAHDFDLTAALRRVAAGPSVSAAQRERLTSAASDGPAMSWDELVAVIDPADPRTDVWDFVCVATAVLPAKRESLTDLLPAVTAADWLAAVAGAAR
jgi:hypothetical protein